MNFTLDTYAWIEYFEGSQDGKKIKDIIEGGSKHKLFTPSVVLAELSDSIVRGKVKTEWEQLIRFVTLNTHITEINQNMVRESGIIKNSLRKNHPNIGLIDAIVLATARAVNSKLLTGDSHLTEEVDVINIKKL